MHDHDGASGAVTVVRGRVIEERMRLGTGPSRRDAREGDVFAFGGTTIHNVMHAEGEPAVTIHAYSPALRRMGAYEFTEDGEVIRKALDEEIELGDERPLDAGIVRRARCPRRILYSADGPVATITLNRPDSLNTIVPPMPDEVQAAVRDGRARSRREGDRPARCGTVVLRRLRLRRRLPPLGRRHHHRRRVGPREGLRRADRARPRADPEAHEHLALTQAGDRAGARLVRRRRQRLRALRRPDRRVRGRPHRDARTAACGART